MARKAGEPKAAEPKPWQRVERGRYRSSDERFTIDQGDPGRWFLIDDVERDELGLARTLGPFLTFDDAKAQADELRAAPAAPSPLAARIAEAAKHPKPEPKSKAKAHAAAPKPVEPPSPPPPPPKTWIDRLPPDRASHARKLIADLEGLGFEAAESIVRRDIQGGEPAVAEALLRRFAEQRAIEPWSSAEGIDRLEGDRPALRAALDAARKAGLGDDDIASLAREIAAAAVGATLAAVSQLDRVPDADRTLPGWALTERDGEKPRRLRL